MYDNRSVSLAGTSMIPDADYRDVGRAERTQQRVGHRAIDHADARLRRSGFLRRFPRGPVPNRGLLLRLQGRASRECSHAYKGGAAKLACG